MTREIALTRGYVALVDDADFAALSERKWQAAGREAAIYARCAAYENGKCGTLLMSRLIVGAPKGLSVDHINGDTLDNRRCNLRVCTHAQNMKNRRPQARGIGIRGVQLHVSGRYTARIACDGRREYLGIYDTPQAASAVYDKRAAELYGEFARLNGLATDAAEAAQLNLDLFEGRSQ